MEQGVTVELKRTPLFDLHKQLQARMVPFAGYEMPVQYPSGIKAEHEHTRTGVGLFDISHMGQIRIHGQETARFLETVVPGEIQGLGINRQRYSVLTNDQGGVLDDLMISNLGDSFFLVVNAARKEIDQEYLALNLGPGHDLEVLADRALLALQGPLASSVMGRFAEEAPGLRFLEAGTFPVAGVDCLVHRCGYTGEDGYEISVKAEDAEFLAKKLLDEPEVKPVGLGARDTLRLEAALCLYGHELDETITPVEADLGWVIARKYRGDSPLEARFPGAATILKQLLYGPHRKRFGFRPEGRIPVREGTVIFDKDGIKTGIITSGGYGQTVGGPVAMGYLDISDLENRQYHVNIRNRTYGLACVNLPFVKHRYFTNN